MIRALLLSLLLAAPALADTALIYDGPGICDGCADAAAEAAELAGLAVSRGGAAELRAAMIDRIDVVIVGGGDDSVEIAEGLGPAGMQALQRYVESGGQYLGLCAGAYLAGGTLDDDGRVAGMRLFAGDAYPATPVRAEVRPVTWLGEVRRMYVQEAPAFDLAPGFRGEIVARYADGTPAALIAAHGAGRIALSGPHPEATADWLADEGLPAEALPGPQLAADLLLRLMAADGR